MVDTNNSSNEASDASAVLALARRLVRLRTSVRSDLVMGVLLEGAGIALGVIGPFALKTLIDAFGQPDAATAPVVWLSFLFVAAWAAGGILATWRLVYSTRVIDTVAAGITADALAGELPRVATEKEGDSGRTQGIIERLPFSLMIVVDGIIWRSVPLALQIGISLWVIAGVIPARYAVFLFIVLAGYTLLSWLGAVRHRRHASLANLAATAVSQSMGDLLRNARRVILNGTLKSEVGMVRAGFGQKAVANRKMMWSLVVTAAQQYGWLGLGLVGLMAVAAGDVLERRMTVGDFIMLETYALRLAMPLSSIGFLLSQSAAAIANIRDVFALCGPDTEEAGSAMRPPTGGADVTLDQVSFQYRNSTSGLDRVSVHIPAGAFAVIVGPNGSGKSTLAQIMAGLFVPTAGQVRVGGQDIANINPADRIRWVLYVPQFISFLNRSLRENALYPPTTTTEGDLRDLLTLWRFYEVGRDVDLNASAGELGERLSGGQIQKLELARVAGVRVPILILDESTSALDPASEERVLSELRARFHGRTTVIMVTHRVRLAEAADTVLFMSAGRLSAQGQHQQLVTLDSDYRALWHS